MIFNKLAILSFNFADKSYEIETKLLKLCLENQGFSPKPPNLPLLNEILAKIREISENTAGKCTDLPQIC